MRGVHKDDHKMTKMLMQDALQSRHFRRHVKRRENINKYPRYIYRGLHSLWKPKPNRQTYLL